MSASTTRTGRRGSSRYELPAQFRDAAPPHVSCFATLACSGEMKRNHDIEGRCRRWRCGLIDDRRWRRRDIDRCRCGRDHNGRRRLSDDDTGSIFVVAAVVPIAIPMCRRPGWRIGKRRQSTRCDQESYRAADHSQRADFTHRRLQQINRSEHHPIEVAARP